MTHWLLAFTSAVPGFIMLLVRYGPVDGVVGLLWHLVFRYATLGDYLLPACLSFLSWARTHRLISGACVALSRWLLATFAAWLRGPGPSRAAQAALLYLAKVPGRLVLRLWRSRLIRAPARLSARLWLLPLSVRGAHIPSSVPDDESATLISRPTSHTS